MGLDASIYQNAGPQPMQLGSPLAAAQQAMSLKSLGLQNQQQEFAMQTQQAMRDAYSQNTKSDGSLDQKGFLSDIGRVNPKAAIEMGNQFNAMAKQRAETQAAQADAAEKTLNITGPAFDYLANMPESDRQAAYPKVIEQLKGQGIDVSKMDHPYDPDLFHQYYGNWRNSKPSLENQVKQSEIALAPVKRNADEFGSRSPNAELSSQYGKEVAPIKSSQLAMNQMIDNYGHKSPQGDASLILNAYKIKFPNAPDVNSLEELSKSESLPSQFKQAIEHRVNGLLPDDVRNDLMRDGVSTYRAQYGSYKDISDRYNARAKQQNVNDPTLTYEPALDRTFSAANKIQDKIGPYVPPSDRGGFMAGAAKLASKVLGSGGGKSANAASPMKMPKMGDVEDGHVFLGGDPSKPSSWKRAN